MALKSYLTHRITVGNKRQSVYVLSTVLTQISHWVILGHHHLSSCRPAENQMLHGGGKRLPTEFMQEGWVMARAILPKPDSEWQRQESLSFVPRGTSVCQPRPRPHKDVSLTAQIQPWTSHLRAHWLPRGGVGRGLGRPGGWRSVLTWWLLIFLQTSRNIRLDSAMCSLMPEWRLPPGSCSLFIYTQWQPHQVMPRSVNP